MFYPPLQQNGILETPYTNGHLRDSPIQQNDILKSPLYKEIGIFEPTYTTKWHFRDPLPIPKGCIFRPTYTKNGILETPIQNICIFETPFEKMTFIPPPNFKWNNP